MMMMDSSSRRRSGMDKSVREELDEAKAEFDKLKSQLDDVQKDYTEKSDERIDAMSALFQILDIIGKSEWRKQQKADKLADDAWKLSEECQARAKTQLDKLEAATHREMMASKAENEEAMNDMSASCQWEDTTNQYLRQIKQLKRDINNRQNYLDFESKTKEDVVKATKKVIAMLNKECDDKDLIKKVKKTAGFS
ncbi:expressed unknown protein [Seminavis robusta]|uniref:Uncharacterized protein n=1 Tax=Seminavis robusta TaxID=568900 RepID=A0A9N8DLF7_9STRA|nr:expressed unknown protein [Seminavis robusta]|eukprot:Sro209_g087480.1 n/a (195) ;mRNA; r:88002-88586